MPYFVACLLVIGGLLWWGNLARWVIRDEKKSREDIAKAFPLKDEKP
jgi:hypothetical protein